MTCTDCGSTQVAYTDERFYTDDSGRECSYERTWCSDCLKLAMDFGTNDAFLRILPDIRNLLAEIALKLDKL